MKLEPSEVLAGCGFGPGARAANAVTDSEVALAMPAMLLRNEGISRGLDITLGRNRPCEVFPVSGGCV